MKKFGTRYLHPLEKKHLSKLKEWRNAQTKVLRQYKLLTDFQQKKWYNHLKKNKSQALFALMVGTAGKLNLIGYCGITNIDFRNRKGEISFLVNPARAKKDKVYKKDFLLALEMLCKYGFEELNLNRIFTETYDFRKKHIKVLEQFGFSKEGELRKNHFTDGKYYNSLIHSILLSEWEKLKNKNIKSICNGKIKKL